MLIVSHQGDDASGIMLNRETRKFSIEQLGMLGGASKLPSVFAGGKDFGPVVAIHDNPALSEYSPADGIHFTASIDSLRKMPLHPNMNAKLIVGQTNWGNGELDAQLQHGCWLPLPITPSLVLASSENLWEKAMRQVGNQFVATITGVSNLPPNSLAN